MQARLGPDSLERNPGNIVDALYSVLRRVAQLERFAVRESDTGLVPVGAIIMWSGDEESIPDGYALCDGNDGTPDLTDSFVIGAGNTYSVDDTGGATTKDLQHTHSVTGYTEDETERTSVEEGTTGVHPVLPEPYHNHEIDLNTGAGGSATQDIMPPYYALAFIMRVA